MNSGSNNNNEKGVEVRTHDIPVADAMSEFMKQGWAESPLTGITPHPSIPYAKVRRDNLSKQYVGKRLIFPSGSSTPIIPIKKGDLFYGSIKGLGSVSAKIS